MLKLKKGQLCVCPNCKKEQSDVVEDYTLCGKTGESSYCEEQCEWCDKWFGVTDIDGGNFLVEE